MAIVVTQLKVTISDQGAGSGAQIDVEVDVAFRGQSFKTTITGPELGLSAGQVSALQNAVDMIKLKASQVLRADIGLP